MSLDIFNPKRFSLKQQTTLINLLLNLLLFIMFIALALIFYSSFTKYPLAFCTGYAIGGIIVSYILHKLFSRILFREIGQLDKVIKELLVLESDAQLSFVSNSNFVSISLSLQKLRDTYLETIDKLSTTIRENKKNSTTLQKEMQYKKRLVSTISHEIKTPLTIVHATINGIMDNIFPEDEINKELENILLEIENTNSMLQEIINVYNIESVDYELTTETVLLNELINNAINQFNKLIIKRKHSLVFNSEVAVKVVIDKKEFSRVISNILMNAIAYSPLESTITINLFQTGKKYILELINSGVTIPQNEIKRSFEPFYRVDKSRAKSEPHGNGLGLYVVSEILKKHGLEFGIENLDNSVKFYIVFPNKNTQ